MRARRFLAAKMTSCLRSLPLVWTCGGPKIRKLSRRILGNCTRKNVQLMGLAADDPESQARLAAFAQGLQQAGWTVGQNVRLDYRWGAGNAEVPTFPVDVMAEDFIDLATQLGV